MARKRLSYYVMLHVHLNSRKHISEHYTLEGAFKRLNALRKVDPSGDYRVHGRATGWPREAVGDPIAEDVLPDGTTVPRSGAKE